MKKLLIPFIMICLGLMGVQAQTKSTESAKNQVIIKKITVQNIDGKETRTETIDTLNGANWQGESLDDKNIEVIIREGDENAPEAVTDEVVVDPEQFQMNWNEAQAEENEPVSSPNKAVLGVQLSNVEAGNGAQITQVFEGSAAEKAGLQEGDILLSVNGKETADVDAVIESLSKNKPGDKVKVSYLRATKVKNLKATLQERKEEVMMKNCSPSCKAKMRCCKPGEMNKCIKDNMHLDGKMHDQIMNELRIQGIDKIGDGKKKVIIIDKRPGQVKIIRNNGTEENEIEMRTKEKVDEQIKEEIARSNNKQSLNVEYLTTSPNPNNGQMKIRFAGMAVPTTIQVLDLNGKEVYNEKLVDFNGTYNKDIDIKNEAKGTLILKIIQGDKVMTQKIIVE